MTLFAGDLTTPQLAAQWMGNDTDPNQPILSQLISSMSRNLIGKLNRSRLYNQQYIRTIDGVGNYQIMLPDYPVTSIVSIFIGGQLIKPAIINTDNPGYGYKFIPWIGDLPGSPAIVEFLNGFWRAGVQNIKATYNAGYMVSAEAHSVPPATGPYTITVDQPQGIWCRDNGVSYANSGLVLTPVITAPTIGQYIPPPDTTPGLYTFNAADSDAALLFSYSYVPADLSEACNQMVAERLSYRDRIGIISKSLGGQETMRWQRGNRSYSMWPDLPPEVAGMIMPYYCVIPPGDLGAPL